MGAGKEGTVVKDHGKKETVVCESIYRRFMHGMELGVQKK